MSRLISQPLTLSHLDEPEGVLQVELAREGLHGGVPGEAPGGGAPAGAPARGLQGKGHVLDAHVVEPAVGLGSDGSVDGGVRYNNYITIHFF